MTAKGKLTPRILQMIVSPLAHEVDQYYCEECQRWHYRNSQIGQKRIQYEITPEQAKGILSKIGYSSAS